MDQAEKDPGLAAQLLTAANHGQNANDPDADLLENPALCIGRLGESRLRGIVNGFVTIPEAHLNLPPFNWPRYRMFQIGVARIARSICAYLEFHTLEERAYTAGLLHDIGKLLLVQRQPHGFRAILEYARHQERPIEEIEKLFIGCTTQQLAAHFGAKHGLPRPYVSVMRWVADPAQATEDAELVAIVSLARDLCLQNHVGSSGDAPKKHPLPIEHTPEWGILKSSVFPSFEMKKFTALVRR